MITFDDPIPERGTVAVATDLSDLYLKVLVGQ
jgi:hypothetical protein